LGAVGLLVAAAALASAQPLAAASADELQAAFHTAFPSPVRHVQEPRNRGLPARRIDLSLTPDVLVPIGAGRYGLVVLETDELGAHSDPGAIGVAYLRKTGSEWSLEWVWPEFAWIGNTGHPADGTQVLRFMPVPTVALSSQYVGQGQLSTTAWIVRLGARGPALLGSVPLGGELEPDNGCDSCQFYAYKARFAPAGHAGDVLSVAYAGRMLVGKRWTPFRQRTDYRESAGELKPTRALHLPTP